MGWTTRLLGMLLAPALFYGCGAKLDAPFPDPGRADFSRTIAVGGTILSGYQDGALSKESQATSIPALIASQLKAAGAASFEQAVMPSGVSMGLNPYPWVAPYQSKSHLGDAIDCNGDTSLGPVKVNLIETDLAGTGAWTKYGGPINDFTVPGIDLWSMDRRDLGDDHLLGGPSVFAARLPFAGTNKSLLESALETSPTFVISWPGMDEVWNFASNGAHAKPLPTPAVFRQKLDSVLTAYNAVGAKGVLATIPDVANMPFFTTVPPRALVLTDSLADYLNGLYGTAGIYLNFVPGENGFCIENPDGPYILRQLTNDDMILLTVPLDSMKCYAMGVLVKMIPDRCSLVARELQEMRDIVAQYNAAIRELATVHDFAVADMESYYNRLKTGIRYDAVDFTSEFAAGGFFSLDGFDPNPKGSGLIANEFIAAINAHYGSVVPLVDIHRLDGVLFP